MSEVSTLATSLRTVQFDNRFTRELPADPLEGPGVRQVHGAAYSRVRPARVPNPTMVAWSAEVAEQLGLAPADLAGAEAAEVFTGNLLLPGSDPHAMNYGGHQFGNWAGQLGDGRAIVLGELRSRADRLLTVQLKGSGPTPYSRQGDGLAVLRSSVREFLCSEAMHHLGVPTTRALTLARTGDEVVRDMLYDGNPRPEPGAIVCRVAPSFLRFGSYQLPASRGQADELRILADFTLRHHFPHLGPPSPEVYAEWFADVCRSSCAMVIQWMRVGFVHGVMNTDNMSIHGITIDYGPYGWLDDFDPHWTPNTTDAAGRRYRYGHQPQVTHWNLLQLANALYPLVGRAEPLEQALNDFAGTYEQGYRQMMRAKLGLTGSAADDRDDGLIADLVDVLQVTEIDMTIFFRNLRGASSADEPDAARLIDRSGLLADAFYDLESVTGDAGRRLVQWLERYRNRRNLDEQAEEDRPMAMNAVNPRYVLRNYLAQLAIDAAEQGDSGPTRELLDVLRKPYDEQPGRERYGKKRPDWARSRPGCSMLSCSS